MDGVIDERFVERLAEGAREGRLLAVSSTDLDLGRQTIWNIGVEAEAAARAIRR